MNSSHKKAQNTQQGELSVTGGGEPVRTNNETRPDASGSFVPFCGKEGELLLSCARTKRAPEVTRLAVEDIDWNYFFLLARRHGVVPLVYRQLKDLLPPVFKQYYQENAARNIVLTNELCRIIKLFAGAGIEAIPYKGPVLALFAY